MVQQTCCRAGFFGLWGVYFWGSEEALEYTSQAGLGCGLFVLGHALLPRGNVPEVSRTLILGLTGGLLALGFALQVAVNATPLTLVLPMKLAVCFAAAAAGRHVAMWPELPLQRLWLAGVFAVTAVLVQPKMIGSAVVSEMNVWVFFVVWTGLGRFAGLCINPGEDGKAAHLGAPLECDQMKTVSGGGHGKPITP